MNDDRYIPRTIPWGFEFKIYSDRIVKDALACYRRAPDVYHMPIYDPPPDRHADGLSKSIGKAIRRAWHRGMMPCVGWNNTLSVVYPRLTFAHGRWGVAVWRRYGDWDFPDPNAYGAQLADELQPEILREIAGVPPRLDFVELTLFRDGVLSQRDFAGTDDRGVLHAILVRLQDRNLVESHDVEFQGRVVEALRLTPTGWNALEPEGEAA